MYDVGDLLGAPPRRKFERTLERRCEAGAPFALMLVDLDQFRNVSARYGANVTDLLLYEVTARLRETLSWRDTVMRSGSSQFAVLVPDATDMDAAGGVARKLIERLQTPMKVSGIRFRLSASAGITLFPQHGKDWRHLLLSADTASHDARAHGRGHVSVSMPAVR